MKKIVIMGATSGIGLKVAEKLAAKGMKVGVAGRKTDVLRILKEKYPDNVVYETIDVTKDNATLLFRNLIDRLGGMDTYLHVSGVGFANENLEPKKELLTLETNVVGFARMVGYAFRYFRDQRGGFGHIAAVTSVAGTNGLGRLASYSSSKCFDQCYLRALSQLCTIKGLHIKFTDIRPGWVRTPLLDDDHEYPMTMTVGEAAREVIGAVRSKRRVKVFDWRWNILVGLWRLIPNWLWVRLPVPVDTIASPVEEKQNRAAIKAQNPELLLTGKPSSSDNQ